MPHQRTDLVEQELCGWEEIREAMVHVETLRAKGIDARIEVADKSCESCIGIILRSFAELQEFISHRFSRMLVSGITTPIPLDDFERLVSEISTNLLDESHTITGKLLT